jgi:hypothetical protein
LQNPTSKEAHHQNAQFSSNKQMPDKLMIKTSGARLQRISIWFKHTLAAWVTDQDIFWADRDLPRHISLLLDVLSLLDTDEPKENPSVTTRSNAW